MLQGGDFSVFIIVVVTVFLFLGTSSGCASAEELLASDEGYDS